MILYHFSTSPFARRVRLVLAHKGLHAELRDAREVPEHRVTVRKLNPNHTVPVFVDGERVITESTAICQYLDRAYPERPLYPDGVVGAEVYEFEACSGNVITVLVDLALRYEPLHDAPRFAEVRSELMGRAQRTLDDLGSRAERRGPWLVGAQWSAADIAVYTLVSWLEGLPDRAKTFPLANRMLALGWTIPDALRNWAGHHHQRDDVRSLISS